MPRERVTFADVAALVSLGLLQEVAASWQGAGLASTLDHAILQRDGEKRAARSCVLIAPLKRDAVTRGVQDVRACKAML